MEFSGCKWCLFLRTHCQHVGRSPVMGETATQRLEKAEVTVIDFMLIELL